MWNFSPRFRSEFLPLGDARGSARTAGVALGVYFLARRLRLMIISMMIITCRYGSPAAEAI